MRRPNPNIVTDMELWRMMRLGYGTIEQLAAVARTTPRQVERIIREQAQKRREQIR